MSLNDTSSEVPVHTKAEGAVQRLPNKLGCLHMSIYLPLPSSPKPLNWTTDIFHRSREDGNCNECAFVVRG